MDCRQSTSFRSSRCEGSSAHSPNARVTVQPRGAREEAIARYSESLAFLVVCVTLFPVCEGVEYDSFPLSSYPMFAHDRPREMVVTQALGVRHDGRREPLPPMISVGTREVLQSMVTLERAVGLGRASADAHCREVISRAAIDSDYDDLVAVELATSTFDAVAYFERGPEPLRRVLRARCEVSP